MKRGEDDPAGTYSVPFTRRAMGGVLTIEINARREGRGQKERRGSGGALISAGNRRVRCVISH